MHLVYKDYGRSKPRTASAKIGWVGCKLLFGWYFLVCGIFLLTASITGIILYDFIFIYDISSYHHKYNDFERILQSASSTLGKYESTQEITIPSLVTHEWTPDDNERLQETTSHPPITHEWILKTVSLPPNDTNYESLLISNSPENSSSSRYKWIVTGTTSSPNCQSYEECLEFLYSESLREGFGGLTEMMKRVLRSDVKSKSKRAAYAANLRNENLRDELVLFGDKKYIYTMKNFTSYRGSNKTEPIESNNLGQHETFSEIKINKANKNRISLKENSFIVNVGDVLPKKIEMIPNEKTKANKENSEPKLIEHSEVKYLALPAISRKRRRFISTENSLAAEAAFLPDVKNLFFKNHGKSHVKEKSSLKTSGSDTWRKKSDRTHKQESHTRNEKHFKTPKKNSENEEYGKNFLKEKFGNEHQSGQMENAGNEHRFGLMENIRNEHRFWQMENIGNEHRFGQMENTGNEHRFGQMENIGNEHHSEQKEKTGKAPHSEHMENIFRKHASTLWKKNAGGKKKVVQQGLRILEMVILSAMVLISSLLHLLVGCLLCRCCKSRGRCCCCCCCC